MSNNFLHETLTVEEARQISPLNLAFIGDGVYELYIRDYILKNYKKMSAHKLHLNAISYVKASAQSDIIKDLEDNLTDEEIGIYKRGRNAKSPTVPKNADVREYRNATGLEALVGFLYLTDQKERLEELMCKMIESRKNDIK